MLSREGWFFIVLSSIILIIQIKKIRIEMMSIWKRKKKKKVTEGKKLSEWRFPITRVINLNIQRIERVITWNFYIKFSWGVHAKTWLIYVQKYL